MGAFLRYLAVAIIGALVGGLAVARATEALPKVGSRFMDRMMERMDPKQRQRCQKMFRMAFGGEVTQVNVDDAAEVSQAPVSGGLR